MRVFLTGGTGYIGAAVVPELLTTGHEVVGLARSEAAADALEALGAQVRRGDLEDHDGLREAARESEGVIHLAFDSTRMMTGDFMGAVESDRKAVHALGEGLVGTDKPFVGTSGTLMLAGLGRTGTEDDFLETGPRSDAENHLIALAGHGVRSSMVRIPPVTHNSHLDRAGLLHG